MTRVALMPSSFWPNTGGVEEAARHLADELVRQGDQVEVWAPLDDRSPAPSREVWAGLEVRRFPMPLPPARFGVAARELPPMAKGLYSLVAAVHRFGPDLVNVHCFGPNGAYATALSVLTGVPLVVTLHGETVMDDDDIYDKSVLLRTSLRAGLHRAAAVTACSAFTLADASRFGLPKGHGTIIFNGVTLDEPGGIGCSGRTTPSDEATQVVGPSSLGPYVLALGRVVNKKGFDLLIGAMTSPVFPAELGLVIGGDGPALGALRDIAREAGLAGRVHFPGRLDRPQVARYMVGAEVLVMPSRLEPFGIVVLEAWRAGTPVVATVHGGPPEFITDGADGVLVDPLRPGALAETIRSLHDDPERRRHIGHQGRQKVGSFAWSRAAGQYREVYRGVLSSQRPGTAEASVAGAGETAREEREGTTGGP